MKNKNLERKVRTVLKDPRLGSGEKLLVCLNRDCGSMLEDACLVTGEGEIREVFWTTDMDGDQADGAAVRLTEDGPEVLAFHESRPSSRDGRPNGIRVHHEDLDFPWVVFINSGLERLTVDGQWVEPGDWTSVREADPNSPEVRKAMDEFTRSPEVREEIETVRRECAGKKRREGGRA